MNFTPYPLDTAPKEPDRSRTEVGGDMAVATVGAGLTGLSAALRLARKAGEGNPRLGPADPDIGDDE